MRLTVKYYMALLAYYVRIMTLFSLFPFDKVAINWGTCFSRIRLQRQLPICLVCMPMRILVHWFSDSICLWSIFLLFCCICLLVALFLKYFLLLWCICFQIAIAYRFHIRGLNIHMASIHGDGIGFRLFSIIIYKKFRSRISWLPGMGLFFPY